MSSAVAAWERYWLTPASSGAIGGPRAVACLTALWILLSRMGRHRLFDWPEPMTATVSQARLFRYLLVPLSPALELALYSALVVALVLVAMGIGVRLSAPLSAVLLYRFAAIEAIFENVGPFRQGLTQVVLILVILTAVGPARRAETSVRFRWGLALMRFVVAFRYLFAGVAKLVAAGPSWVSGANVTGIAAILSTWGAAPFGAWLAHRPFVASLVGLLVIALELSFVLAVISRRAARILVPAALAVHLLQFLFFGLIELALPLLLVFLPWERFDRARGTNDGD